eukprot:gb/GECH01007029.1/.p1 GENE.gb/GECH01007029.1/~~gb/GECH01007029.1/.p1  ORF type:complete len:177 (+),score=42.45 gb/GECH01007029.1/:1-531(+)
MAKIEDFIVALKKDRKTWNHQMIRLIGNARNQRIGSRKRVQDCQEAAQDLWERRQNHVFDYDEHSFFPRIESGIKNRTLNDFYYDREEDRRRIQEENSKLYEESCALYFRYGANWNHAVKEESKNINVNVNNQFNETVEKKPPTQVSNQRTLRTRKRTLNYKETKNTSQKKPRTKK